MIDFHTHVLPEIDDGSQSVHESIQMLRMISGMGVNTIVATPHFYAEHKKISQFLSERRYAFDRLMNACITESGLPEIILGAEVKFFAGMCRTPDISLLGIEGTSYLLLELPFEPWTRRILNEVRNLSAVCGLNPIIAHIERYFSIQTKDTLNELMDMNVLVQINGSYLINASTRRRALKLLKENFAHLVASDCHNMTDRKPNLVKAYEVIKYKLGQEKLDQIDELGRFILQTKSKRDIKS